MIRSFLAVFASVILLIGTVGCSKELPKGSMPEGMIALSFDDASIDNWHYYLPLLDSLGIRATFYVSSYHTLNPTQKNKLRTILAHGNEIAYHTTNHANLVKLYGKNSLHYMMKNEINPDLDLMRNDGFNPVSFAYPYGQHDACLDRQLLVFFKSVRAVCNPKTYSKALVKSSGEGKVLHSPSIDSRSKITEQQIESLVQSAHDKHDCVMFYAHKINDPAAGFQVTPEKLVYLASLAKKYNLQFVTTAEIPQ